MCPFCGKLSPPGYVTCGASECQQAAFNVNLEKVKFSKRRRK